ncbi:MAG: hypothetical protein ACXAAQ_15170 [Candidatus Thorarchaeota archaeon]|jgi:hypothetical protein
MTSSNEKLLSLLVKLLTLSLLSNLESLKTKHLKHEKARAAYDACNGFRSIPEIVKESGYSTTPVKENLPQWEKAGLVISVGEGNQKRYLALENISAYLSALGF